MTEEKLEIIKTLWTREPNISVKEIAATVGLSYGCVRATIKNIAQYEEIGLPLADIITKKGRRPKINREIARQVKEHLTSDRTASLASAVQTLNAMGIGVKKTSVLRITQDSHVSFKMVSKKSDAVLTLHVIEQRFTYATIVSEIANNRLFFIDETGFNLHVGVPRSWSEVGETPVLVVQANGGRDVSAVVCISAGGVKHVVSKDGAFNGNDFIAFLTDLLALCHELRRHEATIVMDNTRIHHAVDVVDFLNDKGIDHFFLPPYTPELNPIENVFGTVKKAYCRGGVAATMDKRRLESTLR